MLVKRQKIPPIKYCKNCQYYPGDFRPCMLGNKMSVDRTSFAPSKCYVEAMMR